MLEKEKSNSFLADYNLDCNDDDDGSFFYRRDPTTECVVFVYENVGVNYTVRSSSYHWTTREDQIMKSNFARS